MNYANTVQELHRFHDSAHDLSSIILVIVAAFADTVEQLSTLAQVCHKVQVVHSLKVVHERDDTRVLL